MSDGQDKPDPPDEDDFGALAKAPPRRSPVLAIGVLALAGVLSFHLGADLRYAFLSRAPIDLGDARELVAAAAPAGFGDNRYVTLRGQPDRRDSLYLEPRGEKVRQEFFRLLGTGSRLFVRAEDTAGRSELRDQWTGRLRRFDTLPYAPSLRAYYRDQVKTTRYLAPEELRRAIHGEHPLRDRTGESITLAPDSQLLVDVGFPEELVVNMPGDKFPAPSDARHELERMGFVLASAPPWTRKIDGEEVFFLVIRAPAAERNRLLAKLEAEQLQVAAHEDRWSASLSALADAGAELTLADGRRVPWAQVRSGGIETPIVIADDAFVLTEGEAPGGFLWAPALVLVLLAFAGFNVWYLLGAVRRR